MRGCIHILHIGCTMSVKGGTSYWYGGAEFRGEWGASGDKGGGRWRYFSYQVQRWGVEGGDWNFIVGCRCLTWRCVWLELS